MEWMTYATNNGDFDKGVGFQYKRVLRFVKLRPSKDTRGEDGLDICERGRCRTRW